MGRYFNMLVMFAMLLLAGRLASAIVITDTNVEDLRPGASAGLEVRVENEQSETIENIVFSLKTAGLPFSTVGPSEELVNDLDEDDDARFSFVLRASPDAETGEYKIPYTLTYDGATMPREGTIGVRITGNPQIGITSSLESPVIKAPTQLNVKLINTGDGEARYVQLTVVPEGYTLTSEKTVYIGSIDPDDYETATFDIIPTSTHARLIGFLEYKDLNNQKISQAIDMPLTVYTLQQAQQKGLVEKNKTGLYIAIVIILILIWIVWRTVRKKSKRRKSPEN